MSVYIHEAVYRSCEMLGAINGGCIHDMDIHTYIYSIQSYRSVSEILVHISYKLSCSNKMKGVKISCHEFDTYGVFPNVKQSLRN